MEQWLEVLYKFLIVGAIALIISFIAFLFWSIVFYPQVKKYRLDSVIHEQKQERDRILIQKANEQKEYTDLLEKHTNLKIEYAELTKKVTDLELNIKELTEKSTEKTTSKKNK